MSLLPITMAMISSKTYRECSNGPIYGNENIAKNIGNNQKCTLKTLKWLNQNYKSVVSNKVISKYHALFYINME